MTETIFITGILGQDGAYLARHVLGMGHRVVGGVRRSSTVNLWRLKELGIDRDIEFIDFELLEDSNVRYALDRIAPSRLFNLAAQSFVSASFSQPIFTCDIDALGVLRILEAIRHSKASTRFYQASSSEMFGLVQQSPQNELTALHPRSPYGVAKVFGHYITRNYREAHAIHASSGILFNHESPLRGEEFVTRKITSTLSRIARGSDEVLELGNLNARRDWGHAQDYVAGMWLMTDQKVADDYVLATGQTTSIRQFVELVAAALDIPVEFQGDGIDERVLDRRSGRVIVRVNADFFRPAEVETLQGDASKARERLGWSPTITIDGLVADMVAADLRRATAALS